MNPEFLKIILGMGLLAVALSFLRAPETKDVARDDAAIDEDYGGEKAETVLISSEGEEIRYTVCNRTEGRRSARAPSAGPLLPSQRLPDRLANPA